MKDYFDTMTPTWIEERERMLKSPTQEAKEWFQTNESKEWLKDQRLGDTKDHINPQHYQGIIGNYQYIECMEFILGKDGLKAHLIGQVYKYMMRLGKKDSEQQELGKVIWYSRCLQILLRDGTIIGKLNELK